jgi:hypothetical protein
MASYLIFIPKFRLFISSRQGKEDAKYSISLIDISEKKLGLTHGLRISVIATQGSNLKVLFSRD